MVSAESPGHMVGLVNVSENARKAKTHARDENAGKRTRETYEHRRNEKYAQVKPPESWRSAKGKRCARRKSQGMVENNMQLVLLCAA